MDKFQQAAAQNLRVWARRMGVELNLGISLELCSNLFPGSTLRGPLAVVFYNCQDPELGDEHRKLVALVAAELVAANVREGLMLDPEDIRELGWHYYPGAKGQSAELAKRAIEARDAEKAVSGKSLAGLIIQAARGQ